MIPNIDLDVDLSREPTVPTDETTVMVTVESLERGTVTFFLEPDESFEVREDGPSNVRVKTIAEDSAFEAADADQLDDALNWMPDGEDDG